MGLRYQKRLSLGPLHLNVSKSGIGYSVGMRGARFGVSSTGHPYTSIGLPGTGVSWRDYEGDNHRSAGLHFGWWLLVIGLVLWLLSWLGGG
jgi:hypothetical protein